MAEIRKKNILSLTMLVMASLFPARAQDGTVATLTLSNIMAGTDSSDPTLTWTTTVRLVNRTITLHNTIVTVDPQNNHSSSVRATFANGNGVLLGWMVPYISPLGEMRVTFQGVDAQAIAISIPVTIESRSGDDGSPDIVASGLVQQVDANGKVVRSYEVVDPSTTSTSPGTAFGVPLDLRVDGIDTALLVSNPSNGVITVTIALYDGNNTAMTMDGRLPLGKVDLLIPPHGTLAQTASQLFTSTDFGNFFNDPNNSPLQQLLVVTSNQAFGLAVTRTTMGPDGSLVATAANGFSLASAPPRPQASEMRNRNQ